MIKIGLVLVLVLGLTSCTKKYGDDGECSYKSITYKELRSDYPKISKAKEIKKAGKIYNYKNGNIILVNEKNTGIHIIDNSDKMHPKAKSFIELPGNLDIAVKDGYLYADSFTDLVVIDIKDINNIKVVKRKEDTFAYDRYQAMQSQSLPNNCYDYTNRRDFYIGSMN